jgi:hypothetical protein
MSINNSTTAGSTSSNDLLMVAYFSLTVTVLGTIFNSLTFIIFCRATFRNTKTRPTLHYMRAMAIFDILMLYGWNLDHYLAGVYNFTIQGLTIPLCRFLSFFNYFAAQSSAWLRVFVCLDRYLSLSRLPKTWFSHSKSVLIVIANIIGFCIAINVIFFFYGCSYSSNGTITISSWAFQIYPLWNYVNLGVYNCAPFVLMTIFNSGVIYHLIRLRRTTTVHNSRIQHRAISITLVITKFLFLIMTIPVIVAFAFFSSAPVTLLNFLGGILYTYHILSFPLYMLTFDEFRHECIAMITGKQRNQRVGPIPTLIQTRAANISKMNP